MKLWLVLALLALALLAWLGRYQVVMTGAGDGLAYVARLDRWSGAVSGCALTRYVGIEWSTWTPAPLDLQPVPNFESSAK